MLGYIPHWNFVDWPVQWPWNNVRPLGGVPPSGIDGGSAILTLQLAYTLKDAVDLLKNFGEPELAEKYNKLYAKLTGSTWSSCWDGGRQLLFDDLKKTSYSQHVNIMGILSDAIPQEKQKVVFEKLDSDTSLIQATFYYRFYLFRALKKVGLAERYVDMLKPWDDMIAMGLTTFAENPEPTRSDCHAWSSSPNYDLLATVCGIEPASSGFKTVKIAPNMGTLNNIEGEMPHPKGPIKVSLKKTKKGITGSVTLPAGLTGSFVWGDKTITLREGEQAITL